MPWGAGGAEPCLCRTGSPNVGRSRHLGCEIPAERDASEQGLADRLLYLARFLR